MKTWGYCLCLFALGFGACLQKNLSATHESGLIPINGTELYYRTLGEGDPILVLHGGPGMNHDYFLPQLGQLAETNQLIFFDQRASGRSALNPDSVQMSMDQLVEDIESLRAFFELDKMTLMSHSWGGVLALWYAKKYPKNLKKLVLINSTAPNQHYEGWIDSVRRARITEEDAALMRRWQESDEYKNGDTRAPYYLYRLSFRPQFYQAHFLDSLNLYIPPDYQARRKQLWSLYADLHDFDLTKGVGKISCPTLIIHGEYELTPLVAMQELADALPNAELVSLPYCGHFSFIEAPEQFGRVVRRFLRASGEGD